MADPFQPKFVDLVRNTTTTTGTSDFVLGPAVNGYSSFADACAVGDQFYYAAIGVDKAGEREVGRGTLLAGGVIARDPVGGTKTNFTGATTSIALVAAAEWFGEVEKLRSTAQPIAVSDFKNALYVFKGEPVTYDDLWAATHGNGSVVPGVGWTYTKTNNFNEQYWVPASQALNEAVWSEKGFTVVMDCSVDTPDVEGSATVGVMAAVFDVNMDKFSIAGAFHDPPSWGGTGGTPPWISTTDGSGPTKQFITLGDIHRFAANFGAEEYLSVNGGPVRHQPATDWGPALNWIYLFATFESTLIHPQKVVVERMIFYPLMEPEVLPELSARPLPTPSGLSERIALAQALGTGVVLGQSAIPTSHTGDTAEAILATVRIPANTMGENGRVAVEALFSHSANANAKTPRIKFGGATVGWGFPVNASTASSKFGNSVQNRGSLTSQAFLSAGALGPNSSGSSTTVATASVDTSQDVNVTITGQLAVATDTIALESYQVVLFPAN